MGKKKDKSKKDKGSISGKHKDIAMLDNTASLMLEKSGFLDVLARHKLLGEKIHEFGDVPSLKSGDMEMSNQGLSPAQHQVVVESLIARFSNCIEPFMDTYDEYLVGERKIDNLRLELTKMQDLLSLINFFDLEA